MRVRPSVLPVAVPVLLAALLLAAPVRAGLGDKLKKKVQDKAAAKAESVIDSGPGTTAEGEAAGASGGPAASAPTEVSQVSTKYDFVPGDKVLLYDDFTEDELGEFPHRWTQRSGSVEVAESDGERWLRAAGGDGAIRPKLPGALPERWTMEFDIMIRPGAWAYTVAGMDGNQPVWIVTIPQVENTITFQSGPLQSKVTWEGGQDMSGRHHVAIMAKGHSLKVYLDLQRVVNVPEISTEWGEPEAVEVVVRHVEYDAMITAVRFAEGGKTTADFLDEGKLVTYGIRFDTGSDRVRPESAPVLREVAAYLTKRTDARLRITGHTDSQGNAKQNLDLSGRRAASVAKCLSDLGVDPARLSTDGKGDTQPVSSNDTAEGRAANRRVEFTRVKE